MEKNFLQKIIDKIFNIQDSFLNKKKMLEYSENSLLKNKTANGIHLTLSAKLEDAKKKVDDEVKNLAKEHVKNPEELLKIALNEGVKTYVIKNAEILLKPIGEAEGFIIPKKGLNALYLNFLTKKELSFKTEPLFVFEDVKISIYTILYNFYLWYSYKTGLPGFDENMIKVKNLNVLEKETKIKNFKYEEIMKLKQSIARDRDAMNFVMKFTKEIEGSKNAYNNLKNKDDGANI